MEVLQVFFDLADLLIMGLVGYLAYCVLFKPTANNDRIDTDYKLDTDYQKGNYYEQY